MDTPRRDFSVKIVSFASEDIHVQPVNSRRSPQSTYTGARNIAYRPIGITKNIGTTTGGTNHAPTAVFLRSQGVVAVTE